MNKIMEQRIKELLAKTSSKLITSKAIQREYDISLREAAKVVNKIWDEMLKEE